MFLPKAARHRVTFAISHNLSSTAVPMDASYFWIKAASRNNARTSNWVSHTFRILSWRWRQQISPECYQISTTLHRVKSYNTAILKYIEAQKNEISYVPFICVVQFQLHHDSVSFSSGRSVRHKFIWVWGHLRWQKFWNMTLFGNQFKIHFEQL
jgi:hypothetical protein